MSTAATAREHGQSRESDNKGRGQGRWYVEITHVWPSSVDFRMLERASVIHSNAPQWGGFTEPGPRVSVLFDGPVVEEGNIAPGEGWGYHFAEPGTYHASARPYNASENASGSIPVRGENPFTIEEGSDFPGQTD